MTSSVVLVGHHEDLEWVCHVEHLYPRIADDGLERVFATEVTSLPDGNGKTRVARRPIVGLPRVAKFLSAISAWFWNDVDLHWVSTNGQASVVVRHEGQRALPAQPRRHHRGTDRVLWMFNPEKLSAVSALTDLPGLLVQRRRRPESPVSQTRVLPGHNRQPQKNARNN